VKNFKKAVDATRQIAEKHYAPRVDRERENFDILDWGDREAQFKRFEILSTEVDLANRNLLDIGCGLGDLFTYLKTVNHLPKNYVGSDLVPEMIKLAKEQQPDCQFYCCDILADNPSNLKFEVVFCSGVFNLRSEDNIGFLKYALNSLENLTTSESEIVFNFLHNRTEKKYDHCFYYDPKEVEKIFNAFYRQVRIIDNYLPNDFTVIATDRINLK